MDDDRKKEKTWYSKPLVEVLMIIVYVGGITAVILAVMLSSTAAPTEEVTPPAEVNLNTYCGALSCNTLESRLTALETFQSTHCNHWFDVTVLPPEALGNSTLCPDSDNGEYNIFRFTRWCDHPEGTDQVYDAALESDSLVTEYVCNDVPLEIFVGSYTVTTVPP